MIRLLKWLIFGHIHEWETMGEIPAFEKNNELPVYYLVKLKCKKCGDWKTRRIK